MNDAVVVIPNHHPDLSFLVEWRELRDAQIIVVQDGNEPPDVGSYFPNLSVYTWRNIDAELGEDAWIIPRKTGAIRSYGLWKAWQGGAEMILTLDTDCYPEHQKYWLDGHRANLNMRQTLDWIASTADEHPRMRGFPYANRGSSETWLSHGTWSNVPDLDAVTQLHQPRLRLKPDLHVRTIPRYSFFPVCSMNLAWRRGLTPALYHGTHGPQFGVDRFDDIWAGVLAKRILDHFGYAAVTGAPSVEHRRQSDVYANLRKEAPGMEMNEHFWRHVRDTRLDGQTTILDAYRALILQLPDQIQGEPEGWTRRFKQAALIWADLFA